MLICVVSWVREILTNLCIVETGEDPCLSLRFRQGDKKKPSGKEMAGPEVAITPGELSPGSYPAGWPGPTSLGSAQNQREAGMWAHPAS